MSFGGQRVRQKVGLFAGCSFQKSTGKAGYFFVENAASMIFLPNRQKPIDE
jgi:hypothetical protein